MGLQIIFRSHASWLMLSSRRNKSRDGVCMHIDILVNFLRHGQTRLQGCLWNARPYNLGGNLIPQKKFKCEFTSILVCVCWNEYFGHSTNQTLKKLRCDSFAVEMIFRWEIMSPKPFVLLRLFSDISVWQYFQWKADKFGMFPKLRKEPVTIHSRFSLKSSAICTQIGSEITKTQTNKKKPAKLDSVL